MKQQNRRRETDTLNFTLKESSQNKLLTQCNNKVIYSILIKQIIKPPTAMTAWSIHFPESNTTSIWSNIDANPLPPAIFNTDFRLRHRKIFTSIILHQLNKEKYSRDCASCRAFAESLEHLFLECAICQPFKNIISDILKRRRDFSPQSETQKDLFNIKKGDKLQNKRLINLILAFARYTIYHARNLTLFENKHEPLGFLQELLQQTLSVVILCRKRTNSLNITQTLTLLFTS